jgi:RNA polymerase sigma factor for flagellar operon FliA
MKAYAAHVKRSPAERDRLIRDHVDVARRISLRMARRCPDWVAREDLVAAALLGLTEAAERYDITRNEPFIAFAEKRIRGAVLDELRRGDIMPRRTRTMARKIGATIIELERKLGEPPSDEQVAAALGVSLEEYKGELEQLVHVTIGALQVEEGTLATDRESPELVAMRHQALLRVRDALPRLEQRDLLVLALYYNEELTYQEIAQVLGVTTARVCQLHGRIIARLRAELAVDPESIQPKRRAATRNEAQP